MKEKDGIKWSDEIKPLAIVSTPRPTTSAAVLDANQNNVIESRFFIFNAALSSLNPKINKTRMLALCGMGGVGKTTMMEQLKKAANDNNMFSYIVKVDVGQKADPIVLQRAVAEYTTGKDLPVQTKGARAELLQKRFEEMSEEGKKNILVMLDDVWETFDLKEIGLTVPLPNGIKLLLSSRDENVCTQMGVEASSIFRVDVLKEAEAKKLFWEITELGLDSDIEFDLLQIGEDIIRRCGGLPLAITTIAAALREKKEKDEWKDTLSRLHESDDFKIKAIFEISYENLENDDLKAIFLLCGLFPEDYNIGKEDLLRYGWGLKLLPNVHTLEKARSRVNTCVNKLIRSNLLLKSEYEGCVKMHDLVRDFVLSNFSNVKQASIVNHNDNVSDELKDKESYERILVQCGGMSKFAIDFNLPSLTLLMLMGTDEVLTFPEGFYKRMEKLEVVAYKNIRRPLLPQYLTNLRSLSLRSCWSVFEDISVLGDLLNLEVLDLGYCGIHILPSEIGNLKKLKLLDLTGCVALCIDDGVLQNLDKLEELYVIVSYGECISFSDANLDELKNLSRKLSALEFEFFENKAQPKYMSFEKLERFRISVGCQLSDKWLLESYPDSFKNTLQLVTKRSELFECKITKLFCKTEVLHLEMDDLINLEDILTHSPQHSFRNLKALCVSGSVHLTCLFTIPVAKELRKLQSLVIKSCPLLKEIWSCEIISSDEEAHNFPMLREIEVEDCNSIVNLFRSNPMRLLSCLEKLKVVNCGSLEVLFDIDLGKDEQLTNKSSLRSIKVENLVNLGAIWSIKDAENNHPSPLIDCFESIEYITISRCQKFRNIVTPTTSNFDMRAIKGINIENEYGGSSQEQEISTKSNEEISEVGVLMSIVALPSHETTLNFHNLRKVKCKAFHGVDVVFEIGSPTNRDQSLTTQQQQPSLLLPYLEDLELDDMDTLSHVWKCNNWSELIVLQKSNPQSSFQNLTTIKLSHCTSMKYLFSPLMVKLLTNLKRVEIRSCDRMEEVVSNRDGDDEEMMAPTSVHKTTTLDILDLSFLWNLQHIGGGQNKLFSQEGIVSWSLCQYSTEICVNYCNVLSSVIPYYAAGQMENLHVLKIFDCNRIKEVFETKEITNDQGSITTHHTVNILIPRNITMHKFPNLKELEIWRCDRLENIFTFSTLESLKKLERLMVTSCKAMKVIVREEYGDQTTTSAKEMVEFPHLKSIVLDDLPNLAGFFLGKNIDFHWPVLDYVKINDCPQMMVFASGQSTTPRLKYLHTVLGKHNLECGLNFPPAPISHQKQTSSSDDVISARTSSEGNLYWSFRNLIECNLNLYPRAMIFPSNELKKLQMLEIIHAKDCTNAEVVFEVALEEVNNESQTVVKFPKLREVELQHMWRLKYIWKSNQWIKLEFPNLTRLSLVYCWSLEHVFTCSMVGSVLQLQHLHIKDCTDLKVVVKEEDEQGGDGKVSEIVFPCLKSLKLESLSSLEGFSLGKEDFTFPSLDTLVIKECRKITVFTEGRTVAPKLTVVETSSGSSSIGEDINSFIKTNKQTRAF